MNKSASFTDLKLKRDDYFWTGTLTLPDWEGFQSRGGAHGSLARKKASAGAVRLHVDAPDGKDLTPPSEEQERALLFQLDNADKIQQMILDQTMKLISRLKKYLAEDEIEIPERADLPEHMDLHTVSVKKFSHKKKRALPFVGYHFGCTCDEEHGIGALLERKDIVDFGGEDLCC